MSADPRYGRLDARERRNLRELEKRLSGSAVTPRAVGGALPEAVLTDNTDRQKLAKSIMGVTEDAITLSVRTDPQTLSTALFPIIGSAIRKAVNKLLSETMVRMNAGLENTFSLRRMAWRFQAWRSGVSYMEILLRNTLVFQVEHVFLIHRRTGILLHDCSRAGTQLADKDMVASMLTAVQDYIRDSLRLRRKSDGMHTLTAGEYSFVVEDGPLAIIALIVRGTLDPSLRETAQDALETIHLRMTGPLSSFSGDTTGFAEAETYLRPCLTGRKRDDGKKVPIYSIVLISVLLAAAAFFLGRSVLERRERELFIERLRAAPGVVVTGVTRGWGKTVVHILRDQDMEDPFPGEDPPGGLSIQSREYLSLEPEFVLRRLRLILQPPAEVSLQFRDGVLHARGPAPEAWVRDRLPLAYTAGGVKEVRHSREREGTPLPEPLGSLSRDLSLQTVLFPADLDTPLPGQDEALERVRTLIRSILRAAGESGLSARIEVVGHAAGEVQDQGSVRVSLGRAEKIAGLLSSRDGELEKHLVPRGVGTAEPPVPETSRDGKEKNRSVTFRAVFR